MHSADIDEQFASILTIGSNFTCVTNRSVFRFAANPFVAECSVERYVSERSNRTMVARVDKRDCVKRVKRNAIGVSEVN